MPLELQDLVDEKLLQNMVDSVSAQSRLRFSVLDADGNPFVRPDMGRWFCGKMQEGCKGCRCECKKSDRELVAKVMAAKPEQVVDHTCWVGFLEFGAPVIVGGEFTGAVVVGGLRGKDTQKEDVEAAVSRHREWTKELGDAYDDTVPALEGPQVATLKAFVGSLARLVQGMAEERYKSRQAAKDAQNVLELAGDVGRKKALADVITAVVKGAREGLDAERGGLTLYDPERDVLRIEEYHPTVIWKKSEQTEFSAAEDGSLNGQVYRTQKPFIHGDVQNHPYAQPIAKDTHSIALAPLTGREKLGVLWVETPTMNAFTEADAERLRLFAAYSAIAIENARTLEQRDRFMELMTHQLVGPLAAIRGLARHLSERLAGEKRDSVESKLSRRLESQSGIAANVALKFASVFRLLTTEDPSIITRPEGLSQVVMSQAVLYRHLAREKSMEIDVDREGLIGLPVVEIDRELVLQVFSVLFDNAIKYSIDGSIIVVTVRKHADGRVGVCIANSGLPIREDEQQKVFNYGYRTREAKAAVPVSTGIGLSIAARIVNLHGGAIKVSSRPEGAAFLNEFEVQFPVHRR